MKKFLAILLILAMLVPMGIVVQAEKTETKPFFTVNWSQPDQEYSNVFGMPWFWANPNKVKKGEAYVSWGVSAIPALAQKTRDYLNAMPEGSRYINFNLPHAAHHNLNEDACFLEKTIPLVRDWLEEFLAEYSKIGGKLDGLIIDVEYLNIYAYYLEKNFDNSIYKKIVNNPAYTEKIRPMLVERGFKFYSPVTDYTQEIYGINSKAGSEYSACSGIWDAVMKTYSNMCITESCEPLWKYYPNAVVSDYTSKDMDPWLKEVSEGGGVLGGGGKYFTAGNSSNENFYTVRPNTDFYKVGVYKTLPGYTETVYEESQFNRFKYEAVLAKNTYLAADNGKVNWWIAPYVYNKDSRNAYYTETLYHLGMLNPTAFLGYLRSEDCKVEGEVTGLLFRNTLTIVNEAMVELTRIVGAADRKPINVDPTFNGDYVLSGMYAGGKNYWRITPDNTKVSLEAFKVEGTDPTFSVGGQTITFPSGKIIADSKITEIGTCGYWIETAEDVYPVITRADDFFRAYPAFGETFESYEVGTEYNYNNALPATSWEVKKQGGGSGTVIADPTNASNKVLEIKGTYSAKNTKMPANVRAGDTYAERQAWEVSFTLPSDMSEEATLTLLAAANEKKKSSDGGFKIAGGKVYYSQNGEYVELEGITLTAGTKYTVVREFDFSNAELFSCTYSVYGADGALLGQAKKIAIETLTLPVYSMSVACAGVNGSPILLDDIKMYQTSVAADFYIYNADTGIRITDTAQAQEGNVAYRLSWLNATNTEKSYTLMAEYYEGDTKVSEEAIKEIKLAAYFDGILTGIVENKQAGKKMVVYLKDNNPIEDVTVLEKSVTVTVGSAGLTLYEGPGTNYAQVSTVEAGQQLVVTEIVPGVGCTWGKVEGGWIKLQDTDYETVTQENDQQEEPAGLDNQMIIIIAAAAAVVVIVIVVIVIVASSKKKKKTAEQKTEE